MLVAFCFDGYKFIEFLLLVGGPTLNLGELEVHGGDRACKVDCVGLLGEEDGGDGSCGESDESHLFCV